MKAKWVFFIFSVVTGLTGRGWAAAVCPAGGDPSPSAPGRTAHDRQQRRPCQMQGRPRHAPTHTPGRWTRCTDLHPIPDRPRRADRNGGGGCWRAGSVSETEQIWTPLNMNDFQHKNVCKTVDTNTRMCYYIGNTRTCYTTTNRRTKP